MDLMISIYDTYLAPQKEGHLAVGSDDQTGFAAEAYMKQVEPMMGMVRDQREKLAKEVEKWCKERGV